MANDSTLVSVSGAGDAAGAIVWWSLSGAVNIYDFEDAWFEAGGDAENVPPVPTPHRALHHAATVVALGSRRALVRPVASRSWDYILEAVEKVDDEDTELGLEYQTALRLRCVDESVGITPTDPKFGVLSGQVRDAYAAAIHEYSTTDISSWLSRHLTGALRATSLRERGGFYFIPRDLVPAWHILKAVLSACSAHTLSEIPAMHADETVEAVLKALSREAVDTFAEIDVYLQRPAAEWSKRGLNSAIKRAVETQVKVVQYANLLGTALPELTDRAETLLGALRGAKMRRGGPVDAR